MKKLTQLLLITTLLLPPLAPALLAADDAPNTAAEVRAIAAAKQNAVAEAQQLQAQIQQEQAETYKLVAQLNDKRNAENIYTGTTTVNLPANAAPTNVTPGFLTLRLSPKLVKAAYLGVSISPTDQTLQSQLKLTPGTGLVINNIDEKSPAESASLQPNDIITLFADQIVINPEQFEVLVRSHKPGDTIDLTVIRQAQPQKISVTLTEKEQPELAWLLNSHQPNPFLSQPTTVKGRPLILQGPNATIPLQPNK